MNEKQNILVVGAGLVGATSALALARSKYASQLKIHLLDGQREPQPRELKEDSYDPRVVALTKQSVSLLERIGAWAGIAARRIAPYQRMHVWEEEGTSKIDFDAAQSRYNELGYIVENSVVCDALNEQLASAGVTCLWDTKVTSLSEGERGLTITLSNGEVLKPDLVVAADGANSTIRNLLDIPLEQSSYEQQAIVTTLKSEYEHADTAWQVFLNSGPVALLPLADRHCVSLVWSADNEVAEHLMTLDDAAFAKQLSRATEFKLGQLTTLDRRYAFPLRRTHARRYVGAGWCLVGDAAHVIHPLAGQGANLGFSDVEALVEQVEDQMGRGAALYYPLSRYARARRLDNTLTGLSMSAFKECYGSMNPWLKVARNIGLSTVDRFDVLKGWFLDRSQGR